MNIAPKSRRDASGEGRRRVAVLGRGVEEALLRVNRRIWGRLPTRVRDVYAVQAYGRWLHVLTCRNANREMSVGTLFLRNRPALELMRRLVADRPERSSVRVAALDISPDVLAIAEDGVYGPETSEAVHASIFKQMSEAELSEMFDWDGDQRRVKPWLREGIAWRLGDAGDPRLVDELGMKDLVVANNFLCHMDAPTAERCLRNLAQLVSRDGYLFVSGVDLDVRTKVALDLGWKPVAELMDEIHDGDPLVRADWPLHWWGLEPLDLRRRDWKTRYASAFQVGSKEVPGQGCTDRESRRIPVRHKR
jgi:SAM-dependent methyltransferase